LTRKPQKIPAFPSREEILDFIRESPKKVGKREIARAFHLNAEQRVRLRDMLRSLEQDGLLDRGRHRRFAAPGQLPEVTVLVVTGPDLDGELLAKPENWPDDKSSPTIYMAPERAGRTALGPGDRVLARLRRLDPDTYEGRTIHHIGSAPARVMGVFARVRGEGRLRPINRRVKSEFSVSPGDEMGAETGDLVRADVLPGRRFGLRQARVAERLEGADDIRSLSLIAIHDRDLPTKFSNDALSQAQKAKAAPAKGRADLRGLSLVTIDGADARDFDDAVWAEPDPEKDNPDGWHLIVAIADVAWYVRPGDALDACALERGNSAYFPDQVVPMLPEELSNGWCSLKPDEDRPCLAAHIWIDCAGEILRHRFERAVMRSQARLTYHQVQAAQDGDPDKGTRSLAEPVIAPLFGAYEALARARRKRGVLELELPERRVVLDETGKMDRVEICPRYDSHRLIEEFMIAANVAAAETLEKLGQPCMYRIHDEPSKDKLEALREFLGSLGIPFAKGQVVRARSFNQILERAASEPYARMVNEVVLRTQAQAEYSPGNIGHFGLALRRYCHFTSPIRRYSDLLVHRALIRGLNLGQGALEDKPRDFDKLGEHLSMTERRAAMAERDAVDRFTAAYLAEHLDAEFSGHISGVTRFGLFVSLEKTGADGLVPMRTLPRDRYEHDETLHMLKGRTSGREYHLGDLVDVRLMEANPISGGMVFEMLAGGRDGQAARGAGRGRKSKPRKGAARRKTSRRRS